MDDVQSLRNKIADLGRQAALKRNEAEQHLKNASTYSGADQADQASKVQEQADQASRDEAGLEAEIAEVQRRLADAELQAAELERQEQDLRSKLNEIQKEKDKILGRSGGFGPIL